MTRTLLSLGPLDIAARRKAENRPLCQANQPTPTEGNGRSRSFRSEAGRALAWRKIPGASSPSGI
jgi:hypothetical protein